MWVELPTTKLQKSKIFKLLVTLCLYRIQFKRKINKTLQSDLMGQTSPKTFSALTVEENLWNFAELIEIVEKLRVSNTYW